MSKPWCVMPFNQMSLKESGRYAVCCEAKESDFTVKDMTPKEFFHSEYMDDLRDSFAFNTHHNEVDNICEKCIQLEKAGAISKRMRENERADLDKAFQNYINDTFLLDFIKFSAVGNKCNLKCIMCGPTSSSLIEKEIKENIFTGYGNFTKNKPHLSTNVSFGDIDNKEKWLSDFKQILIHTNQLQFSGGEPTIINDVYEICNWIYNDPDLNHIRIHMNTNGMTAHYKIQPLIESGQELELSISVDALGDKDEYIRFNTKWKTVERNIDQYLKLREQYSNFKFVIQPTIQLLNVGYIHKLIDYCVSRDIPVSAQNTVYSPQHFNPTIIPNDLKKYYLDIIHSECSNLDKMRTVIQILNSEEEDSYMLNRAFTAMSLFDTYRHTYWRSMWPELAEYELCMS